MDDVEKIRLQSRHIRRRDRSNDNFIRAALGLKNRCKKIGNKYNAEFYLLIRRKHQHYRYQSTTDLKFPPSSSELVS
jgi:hypothetical protein